MMSGIEEHLSRLGVKVQSFSDTGGSYGAMTAQDLAAALSQCDKVGQEVIWRKVMEGESLKQEGYKKIYDGAWDLVLKHKLISQIDAQMVTYKLLNIALDDYCLRYNCKSCGGTEYVWYGKVKRPCPSKQCVEGKRYRTDRERAKDMQLPKQTYSDSYKRTYGYIDRYLTKTLPNAESLAISELKRYFGQNDTPDESLHKPIRAKRLTLAENKL
jgi:hypothetical protein